MKNAPLLSATKFTYGHGSQGPRLRPLVGTERRVLLLSSSGAVLQERIGHADGDKVWIRFEGEHRECTLVDGVWTFQVPAPTSDD